MIQQDQARLHRLVADLDQRIDLVGRQLTVHVAPAVAPSIAPLPPPLPSVSRTRSLPLAPTSPSTTASGSAESELSRETVSLAEPIAPPPPPTAPLKIEAAPQAPAPASESGESWELAFGTVWLARIGIVILLTGLVFLGNYAWQHVVSQLGAGGKLTMLYLAGGLLAALGGWLERGKETMRNYARVLMAGGAATVYYATYAAHYVERLRVIESPLIGGTLLLAMAAGFIVWADRRRSQTLALLAILLAYYTSAINAIGVFTLFSGLLLTGAAVFFLVRHRWAAIGWVSIAGTYGSYAFWRWHHFADAAAHAGAVEPTSPLLCVAFLLGNWVLFSAAAFLGKDLAIVSARPVLFVTANNGAFFALAAQQIATRQPDSFWLFSIALGGALLGLAAVARWRRETTPSIEAAYLAQGIALITLGLVSKLTGSQLALVLALETVLLLTAAGGRHGWLYQIAAALTGTAAVGVAGWQIENAIENSARLAVSLGGTVSAAMIGGAWWLKQRRGQLSTAVWSWRAAWFVSLGLALLAEAASDQGSLTVLPAVLTGFALLATAAAPSLRLPELLLAQLFLGWGVGIAVGADDATAVSPWITLLLLGASLGMEQWWQRQRAFALDGASRAALQLLCATGAIAVGSRWMGSHCTDDAWMVATSAAAIATLLYGILTRAWATAVVGQIFTLLTAHAFLLELWSSEANGTAAAVPVVTIAVIGIVVEYFGRKYASSLPDGITARFLARIYRLTATAALALWGLRYIPGDWLTSFFASMGALLVIAGTVSRNRERVITGALFHAIALLTVWVQMGEPVTWADVLAILVVPASFRIARNLAGEEPVISEDIRRGFTVVATATAWLWVTRWTLSAYGSQGLTVAWSALALATFAAGLGLRERVYRLGGFGILALAIARVFLVDVWRLETLYRIFSFLVLGAVLLLLGFVYNRYAERIRRWL